MDVDSDKKKDMYYLASIMEKPDSCRLLFVVSVPHSFM